MNVEQLLRETLEREAERIEHDPTPVEQVAWRAAMIQRTKRTRTAATTLVAAAAVTALALIAPAMLTPDREPDPLESDRRLASLPTSSAPEVDWIEGDLYHSVSGVDATLSVQDVQAFVPYRGGLLVTRPPAAAGENARLVTLDRTGQVVSEECGSPRLALDERGIVLSRVTVRDSHRLADGQVVGRCRSGWDFEVTLVWDDVRQPSSADDVLGWSLGYVTDPVAVRGNLSYYNMTRLRNGSQDVLSLLSRAGAAGPPEGVPGLATAADLTLDGRWIAGTTRDGRQVVADAATGDVRSELGGRPIAFSPDERLVAAVSNDDALVILDVETGQPVAGPFDDVGSVTGALAWESSTRLLAVAQQDSQEAVIRVDLEGNVSRASPIVGQGSIALVTQP